MPNGRGGRGRGGGRGCRGAGRGRGGLVEPAVLAALAGAGSAHGYALVEAIDELAGDQVCAGSGAVYRVLRRLEEEGCVVSEWEEGDAGPQRRSYRMTEQGAEVLAEWVEHLRERAQAFEAIVDAANAALQGRE
jgi:PadR family transcriptional regulator PadR